MTCLRIPGHERYLTVLSQAVQAACKGRKKPQVALAEVADQWRKITAELGRAAQREAYTRSLGLEP
jgi:multiple sugar transport system substrate-binding protein